MSKKSILLLFISSLFVVCCAVACSRPLEEVNVSMPSKAGALGAVTLESPFMDEEVFSVATFTWSNQENADTYEFELCSNTSFSQEDGAVYVKKTGITEPKFTLSSVLKEKNAYYYWRVSAVNGSGKERSSVGRFYLKADEKELEFDVNYADEWTVHEDGSKATISVDESNFFSNGKNALMVSFVEEDTKRNIPSSDGWIVVTHSYETEMYGVDSFYFNFYYSGNDADVYLRVVDEDNEYWHSQIKVAKNAKQTIIIKFDDFELRTKGGTTIANKVFDYNYIKYIELVFEKSFGDGVAMMSDLRAINFANYDHLFVENFNFNQLGTDNFVFDNYNFDMTVSQDGKSLNYGFSGSANDNNTTGINGWAFIKIPVNRLLVGGDAFTFDLEYDGNIKKGSVLIRVIEEDGDRWVYTQKLSKCEGGKLVVPYKAFLLSEYNGDGIRQFYYLKQMQLGISNVYSTGSVTISDMKVSQIDEEITGLYSSKVADNGLIDDFNGYNNDVELYYKWMLSESNKDEALATETDLALGSGNVCAKLGYKADMGQALYATYITESKAGFDAISLWAMDASIKSDDAVFNYLTEVNAQMIISVYLSTGQEYSYSVDAVSKIWTKYVVSFDSFEEVEGFFGDKLPLESQNIAAVKIGFQYYYYAKSGNIKTPYPKYISNNYVYIDNIQLTTGQTEQLELAHKLMPSASDPNVCVIEDFDELTDETLSFRTSGLEYERLLLSDTTATGSGKSLEMRYKGKQASVSYSTVTAIDDSVSANCVKLLIKGDGKATVYVNIYMDYKNGDKVTKYKYRYAIEKPSAEWTVYTIGFGKFTKIEGDGNIALSRSRVKYISKISFGIVNYVDDEHSYIYLDKLVLDGSVGDREGGLTAESAEAYEGQI